MPSVSRQGCHCCPNHIPSDWVTAYPSTSVNYSPTSDPGEISDPHRRTMIYELSGETSLTVETVLAGAVTGTVTTSSHALGTQSPFGSRRLTIDVTSTDDPWVAGVILWDHTGFSYDPSERGSVSQIHMSMSKRWVDKRYALQQSFQSPSTVGQPQTVFGVAIEQGGTTYLSYEVSTAIHGADNCWHGVGGDAADGWQYVGRLATAEEGGYGHGTGAIPDRVASNRLLGRCDSRLATLDNTSGKFDLDDRPDVSYDSAVSRPITKFGIFIAIVSEDPESNQHASSTIDRANADDYLYDILIDNLIMAVASWGVPKVHDADVGSAPDHGVTYINEALATVPSAWLESDAAITNPWPPYNNESWASGGEMEVIDDHIGSQTLFGGEYNAIRLTHDVDMAGISDTGTVTVEYTWHTTRERDHVKFEGDTADAGESRRVWSGVWLGTAFRFLATKEGADWDHGPGNMFWACNGFIYATGGRKSGFSVTSVYGGDPYEFSSSEKISGRTNFDNIGPQTVGRAAPMDGDRTTIMLRRSYTDEEATVMNDQAHLNVTNGIYDQPPIDTAYPEAKWDAYVWINGRPLAMTIISATGTVSYSHHAGRFLWFAGVGGGDITFGLLGMSGGGWSNARLKARAS
jgi:hypothetical protein